MERTSRPAIATVIALAGTTLIGVMPTITAPPDIRHRLVQLTTAGEINFPEVGWNDFVANTTANWNRLMQMFDHTTHLLVARRGVHAGSDAGVQRLVNGRTGIGEVFSGVVGVRRSGGRATWSTGSGATAADSDISGPLQRPGTEPGIGVDLAHPEQPQFGIRCKRRRGRLDRHLSEPATVDQRHQRPIHQHLNTTGKSVEWR